MKNVFQIQTSANTTRSDEGMLGPDTFWSLLACSLAGGATEQQTAPSLFRLPSGHLYILEGRYAPYDRGVPSHIERRAFVRPPAATIHEATVPVEIQVRRATGGMRRRPVRRHGPQAPRSRRSPTASGSVRRSVTVSSVRVQRCPVPGGSVTVRLGPHPRPRTALRQRWPRQIRSAAGPAPGARRTG